MVWCEVICAVKSGSSQGMGPGPSAPGSWRSFHMKLVAYCVSIGGVVMREETQSVCSTWQRNTNRNNSSLFCS